MEGLPQSEHGGCEHVHHFTKGAPCRQPHSLSLTSIDQSDSVTQNFGNSAITPDGTVLVQGTEIYVFKNKIYDCDARSYVFRVRSSRNNKSNLIYNNVIYNISNMSKAIGYSSGNSGATSKIYNNTFYNLDDSSVKGTTKEIIVKNNIGIDGVSGNLPSSRTKASYFKSPSTGDFSLTSSAKDALDKATSDPIAAKDFSGLKITGKDRDYGAFEYRKSNDEQPVTKPNPPVLKSVTTHP